MNHNQRWRHKANFCQTMQQIMLEHGLLDDPFSLSTRKTPYTASGQMTARCGRALASSVGAGSGLATDCSQPDRLG
jgi:hypothetical protein